MSFFSNYKPKPQKKHHIVTTQQSNYMTARMNHVIQSYANRYNVSGHLRDVSQQDVIRNIAIIITPFMHNILQRYTEADFHRAMNRNFDWVADWSNHHRFAWSVAMSIAHSYKRKLKFDVPIATQLVIDIIHAWNWSVTQQEAWSIRNLLYRISKIIQNA